MICCLAWTKIPGKKFPRRPPSLASGSGTPLLCAILYLCVSLRYALRIGHQVCDLKISKIMIFSLRQELQSAKGYEKYDEDLGISQ